MIAFLAIESIYNWKDSEFLRGWNSVSNPTATKVK
jgi:hypothetical protein